MSNTRSDRVRRTASTFARHIGPPVPSEDLNKSLNNPFSLAFIMSLGPIDRFRCDPANWKLGLFYFCRADSRMLVRKRMSGFGWTLNFARPLAVPFLGYLLACAYVVRDLFQLWGTGRGAGFCIALLLALALIALCYRLANPSSKKSDAERDSHDRTA